MQNEKAPLGKVVHIKTEFIVWFLDFCVFIFSFRVEYRRAALQPTPKQLAHTHIEDYGCRSVTEAQTSKKKKFEIHGMSCNKKKC